MGRKQKRKVSRREVAREGYKTDNSVLRLYSQCLWLGLQVVARSVWCVFIVVIVFVVFIV